jgi:hypothetical protein
MKLSPQEKSRLAKLGITKRIENGTHPAFNRKSEDFTPEWKAVTLPLC